MTSKIRNFIKKNSILILVSVIYLIFITLYSGFVPMWDAWEYVDYWIYRAVSLPFNTFNFDFGSHVSFFYSFLISIPAYFDFANTYLLYLLIALLTILSAFAFYSILSWIFPGINQRPEFHLLTILYLFFPVATANIFQINPDTGVMIFFIIFLAFLIQKNYFWAFLAGTFLVFTKETGMALYIFTLVLYSLYLKFTTGKLQYRSVKLLKWMALFSIPLVLFAINILIRIIWLNRGFQLHRFGSIVNSSDLITFSSHTVSRLPYSYFLTIFVLNFNWILSAFLSLGVFSWGRELISTIKKKKNINTSSLANHGFIITLFLGAFFIMNIYKTFTNPRYFLSLYPLMIVLFYKGLTFIFAGRMLRRVVLSVVVLILLLTNFQTLDPISKIIFGTFKFGSHDMLLMTGITGECCGYGRDQIVYNLEYTNIHYLVNKILKDIKPDEKTAIAFTPWEGPYVLVRMDKGQYERTLRKSGILEIDRNLVTWTFDSLTIKPYRLYFLDFPNNNGSFYLSYYLKYYNIENIKTYDNWGYQMKVYLLRLKK